MLNTFSQVVARYNGIKVLTSTKHHWSEDVRPIGDRRRKHERIIKFASNCYGLTDGGEGELWRKNPAMSMQEKRKVTPILWTKYRDGRETVRVRNGDRYTGLITRYWFLGRYLPEGLKFGRDYNKNTQYIHCGGKDYYLPKVVKRNDDMYLTFEKVDGVWAIKGKTFTHKTKHIKVNKPLKAKYKHTIAEFREFILTTMPLMHLADREQAHDFRQQLNVMSIYSLPDRIRGAEALAIILDRDHPKYLPLAWWFMMKYWNARRRYVYSLRESIAPMPWDSLSDMEYFTAMFNRTMNDIAGFNKITMKPPKSKGE